MEIKGENLIGQRFGRLKVRYPVKHGCTTYWHCDCDCGNSKDVLAGNLRKGSTKSCGCYRKENTAMFNKKTKTIHGGKNTRLYNIWHGMKLRCNNPHDPSYKHYGGRGITMCSEWNENFVNFQNWAYENGYSKELSIDRIDVNGNYTPKNCRWVTSHQQANNTRKNHNITWSGETHTLMEWSQILNINYPALQNRINHLNWTIEKAFSTPVRSRKKLL